MLKILNILFVIIAILLVFYSIYKDVKKSEVKNSKCNLSDFKNYQKYIVLALLIFGFVLYFYKLDIVPMGLNVDEAGIAYDAMSLSRYGVDRYLYHFPVYFINFGGGQNALYTYLVTFLLQFFDYNMFVLRAPAALFGVLSVYFFYKLLSKRKSFKTAIIGMSLMLIMPFFIMKSRWGLESYLFLPMLLISIYFFDEAICGEKSKCFVISGILFGITLYTYAISYMVLPLLLGFICLYLLFIKKIKFKNLLCLGIPLFILALPLLLMLAINNGIIKNEFVTNFISIPKLLYYRGAEISFSNIVDNLRNFNFFKILFSTDYLIWNSNSAFGTLYYFSIPFLIYGVVIDFILSYRSIKKRKINIDIIMLVLFFISFVIGVTLASPNINKVNCFYLPAIYFIVIGIEHIINNIGKLSILIIVVMYIVLFGFFLKYYFVTYPNDYKDTALFVSEDFNEALSFALDQYDDEDKIYVGGIVQPYIYILIYNKTSPYDFQKSFDIDNLVTKSFNKYVFYLDNVENNMIYLTTESDANYKKIESEYSKKKNFGKYIVFYK